MASKFQSKVKKEMEAKGYKVLKLIALSENGYPDLMCLQQGTTVFIECKEKNDTLKPLQKLRIKELNRMGFEAYCVQDGKGIIF